MLTLAKKRPEEAVASVPRALCSFKLYNLGGEIRHAGNRRDDVVPSCVTSFKNLARKLGVSLVFVLRRRRRSFARDADIVLQRKHGFAAFGRGADRFLPRELCGLVRPP